jgi:hypothetical protein
MTRSQGLDDLRKDGDGDLRRVRRSDGKPNGRMYLVERRFCDVLVAEPLKARCMRLATAERNAPTIGKSSIFGSCVTATSAV